MQTISTVNVVVVFDVSTIALVNLSKETSELFYVQFWQSKVKTELLQNINANGAETLFSTNFVHESVNVEFDFVDIFELLVKLINVLNNSSKAWSRRKGRRLRRSAWMLLLSKYVGEVALFNFIHVNTAELSQPA